MESGFEAALNEVLVLRIKKMVEQKLADLREID